MYLIKINIFPKHTKTLTIHSYKKKKKKPNQPHYFQTSSSNQKPQKKLYSMAITTKSALFFNLKPQNPKSPIHIKSRNYIPFSSNSSSMATLAVSSSTLGLSETFSKLKKEGKVSNLYGCLIFFFDLGLGFLIWDLI